MSRPPGLPLSQAVALGLLHGPTELLPVSSSAHTTLIPWLLGWRYDELDPALRKSFEVSLHTGTAVGLLARPPWGGSLGVPASRPRRLARIAVLAGATVPPAGAGFVLGEKIEQRLGAPSTIAAALFAGAAAMAAAELRARASGPRRVSEARAWSTSETGPACGRDAQPCDRLAREAKPRCRLAFETKLRDRLARETKLRGRLASGAKLRSRLARDSKLRGRLASDAGPRDGLALGAAQALALIPGLSRSGLATAAARARGFRLVEADRLCWQAGLPVIAGATLLKSVRQARAGLPAAQRRALAAGAGAALLSTYLSARLLPAHMRMRLLPATIAYRVALAAAVTVRLRGRAGGTPNQSK